MNHEYFIKKTFALARKAHGLTSPNPMVGAVIVKNGTIIAHGYHKKAGSEHAELDAIKKAPKELLRGATLYCNLEPCCHTNKRTPPCAQRIIKENIAQVVIANTDPNPHVCGTAIRMLQDAGIDVVPNVLQQEGAHLNEVFFKYITTDQPFIHLKWAQTLDGKIATRTNDSKWITCEQARKKAHQFRSEYDAVLIGKNTLLCDNPQLTIRHGIKTEKQCPWRIILTDVHSVQNYHHVVNDAFCSKTIIVTTEQDAATHYSYAKQLQEKGCAIWAMPATANGSIDMAQLFNKIKAHTISSVLVEGGSSVLTSCLKENLYDKISIFIAPKIMGTGLAAIGDLGVQTMQHMSSFNTVTYEQFGTSMQVTLKK